MHGSGLRPQFWPNFNPHYLTPQIPYAGAVRLDPGEASAIALALENPGSRLLLDERKARSVAEKLGIPITGILGVLKRGKSLGYLPEIASLISRLRQQGMCVTDELVSRTLHKVGELND